MCKKSLQTVSKILAALLFASATTWANNNKNNNPPPASKTAPQPTSRTTSTSARSGNTGRGHTNVDGNSGPRTSSPTGSGGTASAGGNHGDGGKHKGGGKHESGGKHEGGGSKAGSYIYKPASGDTSRTLPGGGTEIHTRNNRTITTNNRGEIKKIEVTRDLAGTDKFVVRRMLGGGRIVEAGPPGNRVVCYGSRRGFVEHRIASRPGYISRTYARDGRYNAHVYREYRYHDWAYYRYVHGYYYDRKFYGWVLHPWGPPVNYFWFSLARPAPWFGYYRGYFHPEPSYASADLWLTDYLLAEYLHLAYEGQVPEQADQSAPPPQNEQESATALSPEVKEQIAKEVRGQIQAQIEESSESQSAYPRGGQSELPPPALDPTYQHFVVSSNLSIADQNGRPCDLTPGDVVFRTDSVPDSSNRVPVNVESSKQNDCGVGVKITLAVEDLQEMYNSFQEQVDAGVKTLADKQARGLPNGPDAKPRAATDGTADPDLDASTQLKSQQDAATNLERQVQQNAN